MKPGKVIPTALLVELVPGWNHELKFPSIDWMTPLNQFVFGIQFQVSVNVWDRRRVIGAPRVRVAQSKDLRTGLGENRRYGRGVGRSWIVHGEREVLIDADRLSDDRIDRGLGAGVRQGLQGRQELAGFQHFHRRPLGTCSRTVRPRSGTYIGIPCRPEPLLPSPCSIHRHSFDGCRKRPQLAWLRPFLDFVDSRTR